MALVLVLALMVLFSALALAIFFTSTSERRASSLFSGSVETRFLADTCVNLCMAQISDATGNPGRAWISQPGLIRTFTGNRTADENYLLYSWNPMRMSGAFDPFAATNAVPGNWNQKKALFTDLNEPAPDPGAPADASRDRFPILYPPALAGTNVAGFSILNNSVHATTNALPMPVQWLYVLKDGTVKAATEISGDAVRVSGASTNSPVVGRVAFWADDESAKVNVNTAGGGLFWTEPRIETLSERPSYAGNGIRFGFSQPVKGEYQRYPGHPARTDLRAVFPELTWDEIYRLAPRIAGGGSKNGAEDTVANLMTGIVAAPERLFTSPGELRFSASKASGSANRTFQTANFPSLPDPGQWTDLLEKRKGFLTASSRAPELTLSGTPRVAIWPIHDTDSTAKRTALDRLVAFCSTVNSGANKYPFFFTRTDPMSETADISLARNKQIYSYLQRLTDSPFPGAGAEAFSAKKYGGKRGRDQIMTEIFDYIRSTNLQDMQLAAAGYFSPNAIVLPAREDMGYGATAGFGRSLSVRQAGFLFICNADAVVAESNRAPGEPADPGNPGIKENKALDAFPAGKLQTNQRRVQALFLIELFSPSAGFKSHTAYPKIQISGLNSAQINDTPLQFPGNATASAPGAYIGSSDGFGSNGGAIDYRWLFIKDNQKNVHDLVTTGGLAGDNSGYPFVSVPVTVNASGAMTLTGGPVTIKVFADSAKTKLLGEATIDIGTVQLPPPQLYAGSNPKKEHWAFQKSGIFGTGTEAFSNLEPVGRFGEKRDAANKLIPSMAYNLVLSNPLSDNNCLVTRYDTVQTWILPHGDSRMLFGPAAGSLNPFVPAPAGAYPSLRHFLANRSGEVIGFSGNCTLVPGVSFKGLWAPSPVMLPPASYPSGVNAPWTFGDWDTGVPIVVADGPLINKPDEGSLYKSSLATANPYVFEQGTTTISPTTANYHSANRQMPSAVMFGSLPTGMITGDPWQTLLFRPDPGDHPGAGDPADHLLLDLFWMPVVEPYAISEPFSTAGKVNMNYQMIPFTWIERSTGIQAVLGNEMLLAVPDATITANSTKAFVKIIGNTTPATHDFNMALPLDVKETLTPFRKKFDMGGVFITPSEITTLPLVPKGENMATFWQEHRLTGENLRERPYSHIYPRLTTKSNVFNIHYRVQTLRNAPSSDPEVWDEGKGHVVAELRGNTLIERFIDLNAAGAVAVDYAIDAGANAESLYRFRVLSAKDFNP
jgi:hypothetical protein